MPTKPVLDFNESKVSTNFASLLLHNIFGVAKTVDICPNFCKVY